MRMGSVCQRGLRGPQAPAKPFFGAFWRLCRQNAPKKKLQKGQCLSKLPHLNGYICTCRIFGKDRALCLRLPLTML